MKQRNRAIGIIGGMGPEASAHMYNTLIQLAIKHFDAKKNEDFPEIILYSVPIPDFISSDKRRNEASQMLKERVERMNALQLSCLSIACNTAHVLINDLQPVSNAQFVSMIDEVVDKVKEDELKKVGLIGTPSMIRFGLYQQALVKNGIETIIPDQKQIKSLEKIIRNVIKGDFLKNDTKKLRRIADSLKKKGIMGIILGCTELPLVFPKNYDLRIYNSVEILSMTLLRKYYE